LPFPASIPVKYSEDDAQFISIRPLVRQTFSPAELVDMIVSVTGKDAARVRQILRSGTIVFNSFRYWWDAIDVDAVEILKALANYPDSNPSRPFRAEDCTEVILESVGTPPRHSLRLRRADASRKRLFRMRSLWDAVIDLTTQRTPSYREYSYAYRGDLYALPLDPTAVTQLVEQAERFAPRTLRPQLTVLPKINQATFLCRR
jgi:hypothetical protein